MSDEFDSFIVDKTKTTVKVKTEDSYYTFFGFQDYLDDDGNTRQKTEQSNTFAKIKSEKYYVKIGLDNRLYNPIGMFSEGQHNKVLSKIGKNEFNFTRVNSKVFNLYLSFLRTKNLAWLNNANRELL